MRHISLTVLLATVGAGMAFGPRKEYPAEWYSVGSWIPDDDKYAFREVSEAQANGVLVLHYWFPGLSTGKIEDGEGSRFPVRWDPHAAEPGFPCCESHQSFGHNLDGTGAGEFVTLGGNGWGTIEVDVFGYWTGRDRVRGRYKGVVIFPWGGGPAVRAVGDGAVVRVSFDDPKATPPIGNAK